MTTPDLIALAEKLAGPFGTLRGIEWEQLQALAQLVLDQKAELDRLRNPPKKEPPPEGTCGLCGKPMPEGEEMFLYHGYSGPCPT